MLDITEENAPSLGSYGLSYQIIIFEMPWLNTEENIYFPWLMIGADSLKAFSGCLLFGAELWVRPQSSCLTHTTFIQTMSYRRRLSPQHSKQPETYPYFLP